MLTTALFASRHPQAIPLLVEHARTAKSAVGRAGALVQLREMMPPEEYRSLLEWVAENETNKENRAHARRELVELNDKLLPRRTP